MAKTFNERVAEAWWKNETIITDRPMWTNGNGAVSSYATVIAYRDPETGIVYRNITHYSRETLPHQRAVNNFLLSLDERPKIIDVAQQPRGTNHQELMRYVNEVHPIIEHDFCTLADQAFARATELGHRLEEVAPPDINRGWFQQCILCGHYAHLNRQWVSKWCPDDKHFKVSGNALRWHCNTKPEADQHGG